jgi:hypothetical protein
MGGMKKSRSERRGNCATRDVDPADGSGQMGLG